MRLSLRFFKSSDGKFGYNSIFVGEFKDRELWFQTLPMSEWYVGPRQMWYDGPIKLFGFGFCEFLWHYPM